jgi:hypothetical protein
MELIRKIVRKLFWENYIGQNNIISTKQGCSICIYFGKLFKKFRIFKFLTTKNMVFSNMNIILFDDPWKTTCFPK